MSKPPIVDDLADASRVFAEHRRVLVDVAYRMLGCVADAEDVVQEAWLRWADRRPPDVQHPRAYLVQVTTRLAIDRMRRVAARREAYVGPWLPEPILTTPDATGDVELAESVSLAMLVVLETLSPLERAVFVLREAFAFSYAEIGDAIGREEPAVRQLARRARDHVAARRPRFDTDVTARREATEQFLDACQTADFDALMGLLAPDVTLVSDGGGQTRSPRRPIDGADKVARFVRSVATGPVPDIGYQLTRINGGPGIIVTTAGTPIAAVVLELLDGLVAHISLVANPDKLTGVNRLGDP